MVRDQGYWPQKTPDEGLLPPGTIVVVRADNPLDFYIVCSPKNWGITAAPAQAKGYNAFALTKDFSAKLNAEIKKKVDVSGQAQFEDKDIIDVTDVSLSEAETANLRLDGAYATEDCLRAVVAEQKKGLQVSAVLGNFRSTLKFTAELKSEITADAKVTDAVSATVGTNINNKLSGSGAALVWGIKYINIAPLHLENRPPPPPIAHCLKQAGRECVECTVEGTFLNIPSGGDDPGAGLIPPPPSCIGMAKGQYKATFSYTITNVESTDGRKVWSEVTLPRRDGSLAKNQAVDSLNHEAEIPIDHIEPSTDGTISIDGVRLYRCQTNTPTRCSGKMSFHVEPK